jgi:tetratricopeptide (TPR) repeat protein/DNA-binding XRE family transcriptional regulator
MKECRNQFDILRQKKSRCEEETFSKESEQMTQINSNISSFGALLKTFRKHQHLTQQQLAEVIGVHRSTLIHWEQGDFLPESKTIVLELARHLHLDDQETRHLLEASLTALTPHWSVPFPRNPFFTGREEVMEALHAQLSSDQTVALTQSSALHGLGGVGKTQIALEYAYRHALEYSAVFWIGAETEEQIVSSLLRVASVLQVPGREDQNQQRVIAAVQQWLSTHRQWLLIWDNVEDLDVLHRFLPSSRSGALLITTRNHALGSLARSLDLAPMEQEEGILFLLRRAKVVDPEPRGEQIHQFAERMPAQYATASALVTILGGLPLALDQTGAYVEETHCGLSTYLDLFRARRAALLQLRGEGSRDHPASVSTTFTLAIIATARRHPAVRDLLQVCALLQPDAIPEELFRQTGEHLGPTLQAVCGDLLEWNRVVSVACAYSLLARQPEERTLSLHRLVQAVLLDEMTEAEREQWNRRMIEALDKAFPEMFPAAKQAARKQGERLLPQVLWCLHQMEGGESCLALAELSWKAAQYLHLGGRYQEAEPHYLRALSMREQHLGPDHPEVAQILNSLAILSRHQGRYREAEPHYLRALSIREQHLGPEHPEVARSLNSLAGLYWQQGKYAQAEPLLQRALSMREQHLGPDHPEVARSLNNLAMLSREQGRDAESERLLQRAVLILEQHLGADAPELTSPLGNLADLYREQGKHAEAERLLLRALQIREHAFAPDHPQVADSLYGLALLSQAQDKDQEAEALYQRALQIWQHALGSEHPEVAQALSGLASLAWKQGNDAEAEVLYQRVLTIREQQFGPHHPGTAETLSNLALLRQNQGNLDEAQTLAWRALHIREAVLGGVHPQTLATRDLSAHLAQAQVGAAVEAAARHSPEAMPAGQASKEHHENGIVSLLSQEGTSTPAENDPLQEFLDTCCELHPLAWCRISELWHAYTQWTVFVRHALPHARRAFTSQIKAHGCRPDRTSTMRLWRGIRLKDKTL